ncbi:glycohydrolase toxin TNT-related protein [Aquimarina spongiae]|uniref:Rhodanese domain-containing protein n=1 Tax=Aquimarina spongiae TaxID=570521 RepID=A0A1M6JN74_9FLAO|nr:glycohydrolase toxin TNT-related protein [Aquimarina spongiae]SHJ48189.1 Protein of unknown function [Aquimarina spongiae]
MWNKIKIYSALFLVLFSINTNLGQDSCWFSDLATILQAPGNPEFKRFIGSHEDGFMKFRALHEVVGSTTARTNNNVLRFYANVADEVRDKMTNFTHRQVVGFANDFGYTSNSTVRNLDAQFVDSWRVLDEAGVDEAVRGNINEIQLVSRHYDEIINYRGGYNAWKSDNLTDSFFRNVDEFASTIDGGASQDVLNRAFDLYKQRNWIELENLFNRYGLNDSWPPARGGFNIVDNVRIRKNQKFDRYGGGRGFDSNGNPILTGEFTSPIINNSPYSFPQRALRDEQNKYDYYYEIEVLRDLPFGSQNADVIPWFGQPGLGRQAMWKIPIDPNTGYPKTWNRLAEEGYVKITIISSPSGKFSDKVGNVIQD